MKVIKEYIDGDLQVTEYDNGYIVKVPVQEEVPPQTIVPVPPTFGQRLKDTEEKNTELNSQIIELYEILIISGVI